MKRGLRGLVGSTALITGGGSGIGRALGAAMAAQGARVVLADVDGDAARAAAEGAVAVGFDVTAVELDVTDRAAFGHVVDELDRTRGGVDYLINGAGVSMGGWTHELTGAHWDHVVSVNLGGVVNGVLAAYPAMVAAGRGHIVNIASGAGLVAPPFVTAYATTKHAVVGLSLGLRPEAALHGVRVSVLCPGAVETPILDRLPSADLPPTATPPVTARAYLATVGQNPIGADAFAAAAVRKIRNNDPLAVIPARSAAAWYLHRMSPTLTLRVTGYLAKKVRRELLDRP